MSGLGPLIIGIDGVELDASTRERLQHPAVGGVILFERNCSDPARLIALTTAIRNLREPRLLICVDQEGGRVQRLRSGFTPLPPPGSLGDWYSQRPERACDMAYRHGRVMAAEVLGHGLDLSLAPVLDLDGASTVIGDRAMSADPDTVTALAGYYLAGMRDAGMAACGKHFPGHGSVTADTHHAVVTDDRPWEELQRDLSPFAALAHELQAIMMAHVCYPAVDTRPAGYSRTWIEEILRARLGFSGAVITDDLDMAGAGTAGDLQSRFESSIEAGCGLALLSCPASAVKLLDELDVSPPDATGLVTCLYGKPAFSLDEQLTVPEFQAWRNSLAQLARSHDGRTD